MLTGNSPHSYNGVALPTVCHFNRSAGTSPSDVGQRGASITFGRYEIEDGPRGDRVGDMETDL